jgi:thiamine pyrophosphokinase
MAGGAEGLLLLGGEGPRRAQLQEVLRAAPLVIAADSGFDLALRLGLLPFFGAEMFNEPLQIGS